LGSIDSGGKGEGEGKETGKEGIEKTVLSPHNALTPASYLDYQLPIIYPIETRSFAMRLAKSFTIEPDINEYVDETKGDRSASERVNELLRRAMIQEQYDALEAAEFFSPSKADRAEARAFQKASLRTFSRTNSPRSIGLVSQTR
jgi:hypothetical protein